MYRFLFRPSRSSFNFYLFCFLDNFFIHLLENYRFCLFDQFSIYARLNLCHLILWIIKWNKLIFKVFDHRIRKKYFCQMCYKMWAIFWCFSLVIFNQMFFEVRANIGWESTRATIMMWNVIFGWWWFILAGHNHEYIL